MGKFTINSAKEMIALGEKVGLSIDFPIVIDLNGEMGSGKTYFIKGLGMGLGIKSVIKSPTFSIIDYYSEGRWPFYHIDAYRLSSFEEGYNIGLEEIFSQGAIVAIEWSDLFKNLFNNRVIRVEIEYVNDSTRNVVIKGIGVI